MCCEIVNSDTERERRSEVDLGHSLTASLRFKGDYVLAPRQHDPAERNHIVSGHIEPKTYVGVEREEARACEPGKGWP